ncbi:PQQ-binding-like beta-propeller repeat protein [Anatilimnocola floriformis]|uniref:PQQ-binding-like beta-propeller repeat protein n=1 Tax=Anatilimnocola floriformis TaxID=2948575 RepID=UPI0020C4A21D|nr:PQQ-binding-like beta-propeller repeat protein [Anatilimnocola floriformis]
MAVFRRLLMLCCAAASLIFCCLVAVADDWLQFRGPCGNGCGPATAKNLPLNWGGGFDAPAWQTDIPGKGWSSPIVVGDRIWLTTAEQLALSDARRAAKLAANPILTPDFQTHASVSFYALEIDAESGKLLRNIELLSTEDPPPIHAQNSYASPTPACDGERLYCHFGSLGTAALDLKSGNVLWTKVLKVDEITGPGGSPVLYKNLVIIACDGTDLQYVIALDKRTGQEVWRTPRPKITVADNKLKRAFSTPLLITFAGREQLISPGAQWVCSYDPATGKELWRANMGEGTHAIVPRPVYQDGLVYVCTGYMKPELWAIKVDGEGDVTDSHLEWSTQSQIPELSSPLVAGGEIYFVSSKGVATCLDAKTGDEIWRHRLGGNFASSPLLADDKLYFVSMEGVTHVLRPGRKFESLATNQLFGQVQASPAMYGNALLIRTQSQLVCLKNGAAK